MSKNASTTATTRKVRVTVRPVFLAEKSAPEDGLFVWAYEVQIENLGGETLQLLGRLWRIVDARGDTHEVKGVGVIGEQPLLEPGESFAYTSMVPLASPSGMMMGAGNTMRPWASRGSAGSLR